MMEVCIANLDESKKWNNVVYTSPSATVFHQWEWCSALQLLGYTFIPLLLVDGKGNPKGVFPLFKKDLKFGSFFISTPASEYGGPIVETNNYVYLFTQFLKKLAVKKGSIYTMVRQHPLSKSLLGSDSNLCTFILPLKGDFEKIWMNAFNKKLRNAVRKAEKLGIKVSWSNDIKTFYEIYSINMANVGTNPEPLSFFENVSGLGRLLMAFYQGKPVVGLFLLPFKNSIHVWGNASGYEYRFTNANEYLWTEAIKRSINEGKSVFDFGGTPKEETSGLYFFKKRFGGSCYLIPSTTIVHAKLRYFTLNFASKMLKILRG